MSRSFHASGLVAIQLAAIALISGCQFGAYDSPPISAPGGTAGTKIDQRPPGDSGDGDQSSPPPPEWGNVPDRRVPLLRITGASLIDAVLVNNAVSILDGFGIGFQQFDGSDYGRVAFDDNPLAGRDTFTVTVRLRSAEPNNNYKLVSSAKWNGGCNARGFNIGTHYPEFWADSTDGSCNLMDIDTCEGQGWGGQLRANEWEHLAVSVSPSGEYKEYLNGQIVKSCQSRGVPVGDPRDLDGGIGQNELMIGHWGYGFGFVGELTDVAFYAEQLSDSEMMSLAAEVPQE